MVVGPRRCRGIEILAERRRAAFGDARAAVDGDLPGVVVIGDEDRQLVRGPGSDWFVADAVVADQRLGVVGTSDLILAAADVQSR